MPDEPDELLTVAEIAATLKLNQQTIRNWIDAGKIPHLRLGERRVRVYRRDLDAFLAASETGSRPTAPPPSIWDGESDPGSIQGPRPSH